MSKSRKISSALALVRRVSNLRNVDVGIYRSDTLGRGIKFFAADVLGAVNNLTLQICKVDNVEIDNTQSPHPCRG